jgi:phage shock protein PspC (stress-responsive transcriptional regulator)
MIAGVAVGLADYLGVDVAVVRVVLVVLALVGGVGIPLYLAAWLFVPDECDDESVAERILEHGCRAGRGGSATEMASAPPGGEPSWATPGPGHAGAGQAGPSPSPAAARPDSGPEPASPPPDAGPDARRTDDVPPS